MSKVGEAFSFLNEASFPPERQYPAVNKSPLELIVPFGVLWVIPFISYIAPVISNKLMQRGKNIIIVPDEMAFNGIHQHYGFPITHVLPS